MVVRMVLAELFFLWEYGRLVIVWELGVWRKTAFRTLQRA